MNKAQQTIDAFELRRVVPAPEVEVSATVDGHDLVLEAPDGTSDRYNLAEIAFEGTAGEFLWFDYKGNQSLIAVAGAQPMDFVEALLDARSQVRRNPQTEWAPRSVVPVDPIPPLANTAPAPVAEAPASPVAPAAASSAAAPSTEARRVPLPPQPRMQRERFLLLAFVILLVAIVGGRLIGNLVNDASADGVGDAVEFGGGIVIRDVSGVGSTLLQPFSSAKDWRLDWENIGLSETDMTVVAVRPDGTETVLVDAEPIGEGSVGPNAGGSIRLRVTSAGSWRLVVFQEK